MKMFVWKSVLFGADDNCLAVALAETEDEARGVLFRTAEVEKWATWVKAKRKLAEDLKKPADRVYGELSGFLYDGGE